MPQISICQHMRSKQEVGAEPDQGKRNTERVERVVVVVGGGQGFRKSSK